MTAFSIQNSTGTKKLVLRAYARGPGSRWHPPENTQAIRQRQYWVSSCGGGSRRAYEVGRAGDPVAVTVAEVGGAAVRGALLGAVDGQLEQRRERRLHTRDLALDGGGGSGSGEGREEGAGREDERRREHGGAGGGAPLRTAASRGLHRGARVLGGSESVTRSRDRSIDLDLLYIIHLSISPSRNVIRWADGLDVPGMARDRYLPTYSS